MSDFRPKHSLGQNFLIDGNIARKLIDALDPQPDEAVLEIGPGQGALTEILLARDCRLTAVEIDARLIPFLAERFGGQIELIQEDILRVNLTTLSQRAGAPLAVISNLPYYSSSPILFHLLAHRRAVARAVLTLQKEMVDRCCAIPGSKDYGSLSVQLSLAGGRKRLFKISPNVFRPRPRVESAALALDFTKPPLVQPRSWERLEQVLRAAFGQRRKTLRNALAARFGAAPAEQLLRQAGLSPSLRAEQVPPEGFVALADALMPPA